MACRCARGCSARSARSTGSGPPPRRSPTRRRPLPRFARDTLLRWDRRRAKRSGRELVFLADSFTTFTEPAVGRAAIELLEAAGYAVRLEAGGCCGRSSISKGLLDRAARMA